MCNAICLLENEIADITLLSLDFDREKKQMSNEFWKKENGDCLKINSPILCQRYGLKLSHQSYLTHLNRSFFFKTFVANVFSHAPA